MDKIRIKQLALSLESDTSNELNSDLPEFHSPLSASLEDADVLKAIGGVLLVAVAATALVLVIRKGVEWIGNRILGGGSSSGGGGGSSHRVTHVSITTRSVSNQTYTERAKVKEELVKKFEQQRKDDAAYYAQQRAEHDKISKINAAMSEVYRENKEYRTAWLTRHMSISEIKTCTKASVQFATAAEKFLYEHCNNFINAIKHDSKNAADYQIDQLATATMAGAMHSAVKAIGGRLGAETRLRSVPEFPSHLRAIRANLIIEDLEHISVGSQLEKRIEETANILLALVEIGPELEHTAKDFVDRMNHYEKELKPLIDRKSSSTEHSPEVRHAISENRKIIESVISFTVVAMETPCSMLDSASKTLQRFTAVHQKAAKAAKNI